MSNARVLVTTFAVAVTLMTHAAARAATFTAFGPQTYTRSSGQPVTERATFAAGGGSVPFTLRIENGGANGQLERVTSATVTLNGAAILSSGDFNANTPSVLERTVTLQPSNELTVELRGSPGAGVTITIRGEDNDPPRITATVTPPPNATGWNRTPVTVSFQCTDAVSSVANCPAPIPIEGPELITTVTGTATDAAGNTGTVEVVVKVDAVPPAVAIDEPGVARTNAATVRVAGSVDDGSGELDSLTVNGAAVTFDEGGLYAHDLALADGANTISVRATDRAGNALTASVAIERFTLPAIAISAPADLAVVRDAGITIRGTVTPATASVTVNGIVATVAAGTFTANGVALAQGRTVVTATASTPQGAIATANVLVYRDSIPPRVVLDSPQDGTTVYVNSVNVAGMVDDIVVGTINSAQVRVTVNGIAADVSNRSFLARNVPLSAGVNTLTITAVDQGGNSANTTTRVTYDATAQPRIVAVSGNGQTATIGASLPAPLTVRLLNADGSPAANRAVAFEVVENNGTIRSGSAAPARAVTVSSDASGNASVSWTLGTRAGAAANRVVALAVGFAGSVELQAAARVGTPAMIVVDGGNQQYGAIGSALPRPLIAVVVDSGSNRVAGARVTFTAIEGGGSFGGAPSITVTTDTDGRAVALPTLGAEGRNVFDAAVEGVEQVVGFHAYGLLAGPPAETRISGVILDNTDLPVAGVSVRIDGSTTTVQSDEQGQFFIANAPVGYVKLLIDGSTARRPGTWPTLEYAMYTVTGANNRLEMPVYLLPIDTTRGLFVDEINGGTLTLPELPGFALTVKPGSATFPGGGRTGTVSVTVVHADKMPMPPGFGQQPRFLVTIQPPGVHFDPPAAISFPNVDGLGPGEITEMYSFDHDLGQFVSIGTASVSANGAVLASDPGVGIIKGGWHCGGNPPPGGTPHHCPKCQKCIGVNCFYDPAQTGQPCDSDQHPPITYTFEYKGRPVAFTIIIDPSCFKRCRDMGTPQCWAPSERWGYPRLAVEAAAAVRELARSCLGPDTADRVLPNLNNIFYIECVDKPGQGLPWTGNSCGWAGLGGDTITLTNRPHAGCGPVKKTIAHELLHAAGGIDHAYKPWPLFPREIDCANDNVYPCDQQCFGTNTQCPGITRACP